MEIPNNGETPINQGQPQLRFRPIKPPTHRGDEEYIGQNNPRMILLNRNQDVKEVVRNVQ